MSIDKLSSCNVSIQQYIAQRRTLFIESVD